jgi:serine/threonine-protein kinase
VTNIPSKIGSFEVVRQIGSGGMGSVYLGHDPELHRQVAIKVIREEVREQEALDRFFREARAAAALRHPNIITMYGSGQHGHQPYMVMEFVEGESLADFIRQRKPLPLADKLSYLEQLCAGLHFAHRAGIIHRDVKPANVMVDREGVVRILDFGIARIEGSGLTQDGALIGSLNYMSPEQMLGRALDHRSDIFSVGSVAYELLSYRQAFKGNINDGLLHRLPNEDPPSLSLIAPGLPPGLEDVIMRALEKAPENRFQDLAEMRNAILGFHSGAPGAEDRTIVIARPAAAGSPTQPASTTDLPVPVPNSEAPFDFDNVREDFTGFKIPDAPSTHWTPATPPTETAIANMPRDTASWTLQTMRVPAAEPTAPPEPPAVPVQTPSPPSTPIVTGKRATTSGGIRSSTASGRSSAAPETASRPSRHSRRWVLASAAAVVLAAAAVLAVPLLTAPPPDPLEVERPGIEAAMERFRIGYRNRDMDAVLVAFPELPGSFRRAMQRTFDRCIVYDVSFVQMNISLTRADAAEAEVRSTHSCTPDSGAPQTTEMQHEVYTLRKSGQRWEVNSVRRVLDSTERP